MKSLFEAGMLVFFGAAWPISIIKSWKSKSTGGKSVLFSYVVVIGYVCGLLAKVFDDVTPGYVFYKDYVFWLYVLNLAMVTADLLLWYRNRAYEKSLAK